MMKRCIISMGVWGIRLENLNVKNKKEKEKSFIDFSISK